MSVVSGRQLRSAVAGSYTVAVGCRQELWSAQRTLRFDGRGWLARFVSGRARTYALMELEPVIQRGLKTEL